MPEGYCVKERKKVEIQDPQQVTMKNGRPAIQGTCPDCGTKIFKIGKLDLARRYTSGGRRPGEVGGTRSRSSASSRVASSCGSSPMAGWPPAGSNSSTATRGRLGNRTYAVGPATDPPPRGPSRSLATGA